jgi:diadenylate cyclase
MRGDPKTMQEAPSYADCPSEVFAFLLEAAARAEAAGIGRDRIILDPGIGFGKRLGDNLALLGRLGELSSAGYPVLVGLSRKAFVGAITGKPAEGRLAGSLGAACAAYLGGARIFRVHDPAETADALALLAAALAGGRPPGGGGGGRPSMNVGSIGLFFTSYVRPALDVLLLAYILYKTYEVLVRTQAIQLVKGALVLAAVYGVALFLQLTTVAWILNILAPGLVIALAIVFQPELRKIVMRLGQGSFLRGAGRPRVTQIEAVLNAAEMLSTQRRGALIVFARNVGLKNIVDTGTRLDSLLSSSLIQTVFGHDTPLHDGALVVQDGRVAGAGCFLPLSEQQDIRKSFGTRHRAALGLSEESDAVILVVSEETGALSLAYESKLYYGLALEQVRRRLGELLEFPAQAAGVAQEAADAE